MKKILFPFRIGESIYKEAFVTAAKFARNMNAELILLNAFEVETDNSITQPLYEKALRKKWFEAYNEVVSFNNYFFAHHAIIKDELNIRLNHRYIHAIESKTIKEIIHNEKIDLLILPFSENKKHNKEQLNLIQDERIENSATSVLILPKDYKYQSIKNIAFATDLKYLDWGELYLKEIAKYANVFNANIHFIYVNNKANNPEMQNNKTLRMIEQIIKKNPRHCYKSLKGSDICETIQKYVRKQHMQLLSVVKEETNFFREIFHHSVSEETIQTSIIPVLYMVEKKLF